MRNSVFHMVHCSAPMATTKPENQWQRPETTYRLAARKEDTLTYCAQPGLRALGFGSDWVRGVVLSEFPPFKGRYE